MRVLRSWLLSITITCLPAISAAEPFQIPKQDFTASVHVIALLHTLNRIDGSEVGTKLVDDELAQHLRTAGFEVREAALYQAIETEAREASGGWFDRWTGSADRLKRTSILNRAMATYQTRYKVDAFLRAQITQIPVKYTNERHAQWDGVEENIIASETLLASINHVVPLFGPSVQNGQFPASSLNVMFYDPQGKILYSNSGGIGALSALARNHFVSLDASSLLADSSRVAQAVDIALGPLSSDGDSAHPAIRPVTIGNLLDSPSAAQAATATQAAVQTRRSVIQKTVKTIAIAQMELITDWYQDTSRAIYQNRMSQLLQEAGYNVVSPWTYQHTAQDAAEEVGGIYDPIWGTASKENLAKAHEIHTHALRSNQHVDAILYASFAEQSVPFNGKGVVEWDGISRPVFSQNTRVNPRATGAVPVLSLAIRLTDMDGNLLYSKRVGIDALAEYSGSSFYTQRSNKILDDEDKAIATVKVALSGLTEDH